MNKYFQRLGLELGVQTEQNFANFENPKNGDWETALLDHKMADPRQFLADRQAKYTHVKGGTTQRRYLGAVVELQLGFGVPSHGHGPGVPTF